MAPDICFLVFAQVRRHARQNFGTLDHALRFYGNCRTLKEIIK